MHIWVLWWSWRTGTQVITEALVRWYTVTTLVRTPSKLDPKLSSRIEVIAWDATAQTDIERILWYWIDVLIHTISVPFFHTSPTTLYSRVTRAVIAARETQDHTCRHYLVMSSFWTHHGRRLPFPFQYGYEYFLGDVADDKEREEQFLETSSLPWTVIKAILLTDTQTSSYTTTPFQEFSPTYATMTKRVSRRAVASASLDCAWDQNCFNARYVVS